MVEGRVFRRRWCSGEGRGREKEEGGVRNGGVQGVRQNAFMGCKKNFSQNAMFFDFSVCEGRREIFSILG